jgi:hypothetical protein
VPSGWGFSYWRWEVPLGKSIESSEAQCRICGILYRLFESLLKDDGISSSLVLNEEVGFLVPLEDVGDFLAKFSWPVEKVDKEISGNQPFQLTVAKLCTRPSLIT